MAPWLPEIAEAVAGRRLNVDRIPEPVSWAEQTAVLERLAASAETDDYARWVRRVLDHGG